MRVLIFTAKIPYCSKDADGGTIMVEHLIDILHSDNVIDLLLIQNHEVGPIKNVNSIKYLKTDFLRYDTYNNKDDSKFIIRLRNINVMSDRIKKEIDNYDMIIIIHCLQAMGLDELTDEQKKKIILFPMFLSKSYQRSGDLVPEEYIKEERKALLSVGTIITPSIAEKKDIMDDYDIDESKIIVIPRAVDPVFYSKSPKPYNPKKTIKMIYIASFKNQKNNLACLDLLDWMEEHGFSSELHLAGPIQDDTMYNRMIEELQKKSWKKNSVIYHGTLNKMNLCTLMRDMDLAISLSRWETFGRGIIEGLAIGLPTVVFEQLECIKQMIGYGKGVVYAKDIPDMGEKIIELINHEEKYTTISESAILTSKKYTIEQQNKRINQVVSRIR